MQPRILTTEEALRSGDPLLRLKAHTLGAVVALVPATLAVFIGVSRRLEIQDAVALQAPGSDLPVARLWRRYVAEAQHVDPFAPHALDPRAENVLALAHIQDDAPRYVEHLRSAGLRDRMTVYLRLSGTIVATITLLRAADQPRFERGDALTLRRIQPLVEHAYVCAVEPGRGAASAVLRGSGLTSREADVAELVGRGATNAEIARSLHVSEATVKTHLTRIYTKVGVRTRTQLAILVGGSPSGPIVST